MVPAVAASVVLLAFSVGAWWTKALLPGPKASCGIAHMMALRSLGHFVLASAFIAIPTSGLALGHVGPPGQPHEPWLPVDLRGGAGPRASRRPTRIRGPLTLVARAACSFAIIRSASPRRPLREGSLLDVGGDGTG